MDKLSELKLQRDELQRRLHEQLADLEALKSEITDTHDKLYDINEEIAAILEANIAEKGASQ